MALRRRTQTVRRETVGREKKKEETRGTRPPRFSVILCTYNRRNFVLAALATLRRQTFPSQDFEIIVVDNGSQDGTLSALNSYLAIGESGQEGEENRRVRCLSEPKNGLAYARNTGLLASTGEIVVFLDDDTLVDPRMLEHLWQAYEETRADAIGMRVEMHWDMPCPHWMIAELLDVLGRFSPLPERSQLAPGDVFASCAFSVKRDVLHAINFFSPFLSRRVNLPSSVEIADLCYRLHEKGYALWYEPQALVMHRATSVRLRPAFFVGRAYWQGRYEVMLEYLHTRRECVRATWHEVLQELGHFARCLLLEGPLIRLVGRPTTEHLLAAMERSHSWGRLIQHLMYLEHVPSDLDIPAICLIYASIPDVSRDLLVSELEKQEVRYLTGQPEISLRWLWQHRRYREHAVGILHFYRPGALELTRSESQRLRFRLWLARRWGLRIVVTDNGGVWQSVRGSRFRERRVFERKLLHASHAILCSTKQPNQLYRERRLRRRVRTLPQPGFRGYYPSALPRDEAHQRIGLPSAATFVYLCLAHLHTESEIIFLLEAFYLLTQGSRSDESVPGAYLLLVGNPVDCEVSSRILRLIARDSHVHHQSEAFKESDLPLYMGACNAQVQPHLNVHTAGSLESAAVALSYERFVIAPDLPRFRGMLPPRVSVPYVPASRESLAEAMVKVQQMTFALQEEEFAALDARQSWSKYAGSLIQIYRELLGH
ncbi:MAG TPA: glycosyltransferase [Ktedonobacteraceae bacterium]|nr:glycosyltransferase [Ktedonobacteraceae bacterium]